MSELNPEFQRYMSTRSAGLVRLAWLLTGDINDAEDLVQTALARAFQHWGRIVASDDIDAYVRRIIVNSNKSRFRRRRVNEVPLSQADQVGFADPGLTTVNDRAGLGQALRSLSVRQRQVLVLRYIEDLSERETAGILGCSVGTVKSTASRGLAALRSHPALGDSDVPRRWPRPAMGVQAEGATP